MDPILQRFKSRKPIRRAVQGQAAQTGLVKQVTCINPSHPQQPCQPGVPLALQDHPVEQHLSALLLDHVADTDRRTRSLAARFDTLLEMLFSGVDVDARATLELINGLGRLHRAELAEVRRCAELVTKITRPAPPSLQVVATGAQINMGQAQQITGPAKD